MQAKFIALFLAAGLSSAMFEAPDAAASAITYIGTLPGDDAVAEYTVVLTEQSNLALFTTSYGGGPNLDGTFNAAGGFEPILSLFDTSEQFVVVDGGDLFPYGNIDPATGVSGDAFLSLTNLGPGTYTVALTEFFNYPNGNLSDGFFEDGQGNFTGPTCSQSDGSFLQTNLTDCPQRTSAFTLNISSSPVPEPITSALVVSGLLSMGWSLRRKSRPT